MLCRLRGGAEFPAPAAAAGDALFERRGSRRDGLRAGHGADFTPGAAVAADWWRLFQSAQLDAVMKRGGRQQSRTGRGAGEPAREPEQSAQRLRHLLPAVDADAGASRERFTSAEFRQNLPSSVFNLFTLSATRQLCARCVRRPAAPGRGLRAEVDVAARHEQADLSDARRQHRQYHDRAGRLSRRNRRDPAAHRSAEGAGRARRISGAGRHRALCHCLESAKPARAYEATSRSSSRSWCRATICWRRSPAHAGRVERARMSSGRSRCRAICRSACPPIWCASAPTSWRPRRPRMRPAPISVSPRPRCCRVSP